MTIFDVIIIGGGQSGLVTGYFLKQHAVDFAILDANEAIGGSWQHYYESLKLFSPAKWAELPGLPFPGDSSHYPTRYEVIEYLREYARVHELPVRSGVRVQEVTREGDVFALHTADGKVYHARAVISATGPFNTPYTPHINGMERFGGAMLHAYDYHRPEPYTGQHVVVVGSRDSAMQIAYELASVARVSMAVRHKLKFMPRRFLGINTFWWLHETGYDEIPLGLFTDLHGTDKIMGKEPYQAALAAGNPKPKPMFTEMTETGVVWGDGTVENADTVLFATGYKQGVDYLAPLGALDADGNACHRGGVSDRVAGLFYVGLFGQRSPASATLRGVDRDARIIARKTAQYLREQKARQTTREFAAGD